MYLCVSFGYGEEAEVWAANISIERPLYLGEAANISLLSEDGESLTIESEIIHVGETNEGNLYAIATSEEPIEDENFREALLFSDWTKLHGDDSLEVHLIVENAPPVAALHDLLLVVGDYNSVDEAGYPNKIQVWHRLIEPSDVVLPLFGERFLSHVVLSNNEIESDVEELTLAEGESLVELFSETGEEYAGADDGLGYNEDEEDEPVIYMEDQEVDIYQEGSPELGYPVLAFYTAKTGYGVASIGVWCPDIAPYTEFDLIADGWEQLGEELFNAMEFRLKERIDLALQTKLVLYSDEDGVRFVGEYALEKPELVEESHFELLPLSLQDFAASVTEINKELDNIDDVIGGWITREDSDSEKPKE